MPFFVTVTLLCMSLILLAFVLAEHQWESNLINWQHILSEIGFYTCIVLVLYLSSVGLHSSAESDVLGWTLISVVLTVMAINTICILTSTLKFFYLCIMRSFHKQYAC